LRIASRTPPSREFTTIGLEVIATWEPSRSPILDPGMTLARVIPVFVPKFPELTQFHPRRSTRLLAKLPLTAK
jgi:hypothetical protein